MPPRKRLGQLLTELKVIDEAQLQSALGHQKQWGGKIGAILVEKGFCSEDQMVAVLSQHLGIATVKLLGSQVDPRAVKAVSRAVAERLHVFAYEIVGAGRSEVVSVAMSDPTDLSAVDQLAFHTGKRIKAMLASDSEILAAIEQHYLEGGKGKSGTNVRPLAAAANRPTPLRVAPPVATAVEPVAKVEPPRPAPYIPPPVPQNAKPQPVALDEIELPSEGNGQSAHGFDAEQERLRQQFPATDAIEAPPEPEEPMTLETPATLQGWKEGPQAAGIDWQEKTGPIESKEQQPASGSTAADTEPVPEAEAPSEWHDGGGAAQEAEPAPPEWQAGGEQERVAEEAPAEWSSGEERGEAAKGAPAEWHAGEEGRPAEEAPAEWRAGEEQAAAEAAPAEWQAPEESAQEAQTPAAAQGGEERAEGEQAPAEWQGEQAPAEEAPSEWQAEADQTQPAEPAPAEWAGTEEAPAETAPAEWGEGEVTAESREWSEQGQQVAAAAETSSDWGGAPAQEKRPREWSAQEPRVPEARAQEFPREVPQDAWEDVPVEDATEAPEQWSESKEPASEGSAFAAEAPPAGGPVALPGPREPAIAEAFAEQNAPAETAGAEFARQEQERQTPASNESAWAESGDVRGEEPAYGGAGAAEESTDRFRTPRATAAFGGEAPLQEALEGEDRAEEEWPPQEATQEEVEWAAAPEPLSAADVATLAALGIDPGDVTGAMRAVACLVRVLNRRQAIDVEELAAEIRESRASSAEVASSEGNPGAEESGPIAGSRE